jgi:hypothetical protein
MGNCGGKEEVDDSAAAGVITVNVDDDLTQEYLDSRSKKDKKKEELKEKKESAKAKAAEKKEAAKVKAKAKKEKAADIVKEKKIKAKVCNAQPPSLVGGGPCRVRFPARENGQTSRAAMGC